MLAPIPAVRLAGASWLWACWPITTMSEEQVRRVARSGPNGLPLSRLWAVKTAFHFAPRRRPPMVIGVFILAVSSAVPFQSRLTLEALRWAGS